MKRLFSSKPPIEPGAQVLASATIALGLSVMTGWYLQVQWLVQAIPGHAPMQFNTALCFVFSGLAIALISTKAEKYSLWFLVPVLILSSLNLFQYLLHRDLGIDQIFINHFIQVKTPYPGRMAPNTAIAFLLFSFSLLLLRSSSSGQIATMLALSSTIITAMFGAAAVLGYLGNVESSYGWGNVTQMAFNTALGFIALGLGAFFQVLARAQKQNSLRTSIFSAVAGITIALFGIYMWNALSRAEHTAIQENTEIALHSAKDRLFTRVTEVTRALRRMADRVEFGMDDSLWQKDSEIYFRDFPSYKGLFITDQNGSVLAHARIRKNGSDSLLKEGWSSLSPWGKDGARVSNLISQAGDKFFLVALPVRGPGPDRYLAVIINAGEFYGQILGQSFVAPGYSLAGLSGEAEFLSRLEKGGNTRTDWSVKTDVQISEIPWELQAWPSEETLASRRSSLALMVLISSLLLGFLLMYAIQMAEVARKAQSLAEQATEAKSNFLSNMSHEIRTPLTAIIGFTESLRAKEFSEEESQEALQIVEKNSKHLLRLINDILDLSKIEAGKLEVEVEKVCLVDLLSDLSNFIRPQAEAKNLSFGFEYQYPIPQLIVTDPLRLKQILINLIGNAVKFTQTGGVKVSVKYLCEENLISFAVIDTGIGLTAQQQSGLFQAFSQADATTTRKFGGTGLGLLISSQLAEKLGGEISIESSPERGSIFTLMVPAGTIDQKDLIERMQEPRTTQHKPGGTVLDSFSGHVLLAEDGKDNQRYITFLLKKMGLNVTLVDNGLRAVEQARINQFDLILMDMQMPVMDGYTAMRQLRTDGSSVPIIALTANAMRGDMERCREAGCSDFLGKPFSREEFFEKVRAFLQQKPAELPLTPQEESKPSAEHLSNDPAFLSLIHKYERNLGNRYASLEAAFEAGDFAKLESLAHQLSGSGGYYGHSGLSLICQRLETAAARHDSDCSLILEEIRRYISKVSNANTPSPSPEAQPESKKEPPVS